MNTDVNWKEGQYCVW